MQEDNFILNAARLNLSEENIAALKKILKKNIDWPLFEMKARVHGVDTFIYYSLKNHNLSELIPPETYKRFQEHYYEIAYQNSVFLDEVDKLSAIINDKIVLLKGMDLIQSLYPNIAIRSMSDIDILVDSEKDKEVWNKLKKNGFAEPDIGVCKSSLHRRNPIQISSERFHNLPDLTNGKCHLEVHWNIFQSPHFFTETKMAWEKAIPIKADQKTYRLSNEFLLAHLCSHLYFHKHQYVILRMICDINELIIQQKDPINWNEIDEICNNTELKNIIITALTYPRVLLKTPVPANFINENIVFEKTFNLDVLLKGQMQRSHTSYYLDVLKSISNPSDKIKYIYKTIIPSKEWMRENYHTQSGIKLVMAYIKYWSFQLNTNIIKRGIRNGN